MEWTGDRFGDMRIVLLQIFIPVILNWSHFQTCASF